MDNKQFVFQEGHRRDYTISEYLEIMAPIFQRQQAIIDRCVAGLTIYAAGLMAQGRESDALELGRFISGMAEFWDSDKSERQTAELERAIAAARASGEAPALTEQNRADICAGLELHANEMRVTDSELEQGADRCESFAEALREEWQEETSPQINMELGGM